MYFHVLSRIRGLSVRQHTLKLDTYLHSNDVYVLRAEHASACLGPYRQLGVYVDMLARIRRQAGRQAGIVGFITLQKNVAIPDDVIMTARGRHIWARVYNF